jgi:hypothetical protein
VSDEARIWGRVGGLTAWARNEPEVMIGPAHAGFRRRFERLVDPNGRLDPAERAIRADRARRAWMLTLAARSVEARRNKRADPVAKSESAQEVDRGNDHTAATAA